MLALSLFEPSLLRKIPVSPLPTHIMAPSAVPVEDQSMTAQQCSITNRFLSNESFPPTPNTESVSPKHETIHGSTISETNSFRQHLSWVIEHDHVLQKCVDAKTENALRSDVIVLSGEDLTLAELVAVAW
jgi:hypothetical protein